MLLSIYEDFLMLKIVSSYLGVILSALTPEIVLVPQKLLIIRQIELDE